MCSKFKFFKDCLSLENVHQRNKKSRSVSALDVGKTRNISARCKTFSIPNTFPQENKRGHTLYGDLHDRNFLTCSYKISVSDLSFAVSQPLALMIL